MSGAVAEFLLSTALLMALVMAVRPLVRRWCGAPAAYALWIIPALRLLMPVGSSPAPAIDPSHGPIDVVFATAAAAPVSLDWLIWPWAAGALLFAGWQIVAYRRFLHRALDGAERLNASGTPVFATAAVDGPAAVGIHDWRILVPVDFETRFTPAERELAMRHELRHLNAGHLIANAAALAMLALHWFNPLAHRAYRAFREDQELSCDAAVIADADAGARAAYGAAMVKSLRGAIAGGRAAPMSTCPMTRADTLKRRLSMITRHRNAKRAYLRQIAAVVPVAIAGAFLTATSGIAAEPAGTIRKITVKQIQGNQGVAEALGREMGQNCKDVGERIETTSPAQPGGKPVNTVFIVCNKGGTAPVDRLGALEKIRAGMAANTTIDAAQRDKVLASLDGIIAKLKAE